MPLYRDRGMHVIYLGDEAIMPCDEFTLEGRGDEVGARRGPRVDRDHRSR